MAVDYPGALDYIITSPDWVFTDALTYVPARELSIVIHKTASNGYTTATQTALFFQNDLAGHKSVHFIVGRDGSVLQVVRLKDGAGGNCCLQLGHDPYWNLLELKYGNLNRCTISIEHEDWTADNTQAMTPEQIRASFALVLWLMERYKLQPYQIKGHNSLDPISRAHCPGDTYPMDLLRSAMSMNDFIKQAAKDTWECTRTNLRYDSGIAQAWQNRYYNGVNMPPPTTGEFQSVDWSGKPIIVQFFGTLRCEWHDGTAHWMETGTI